MADASIVTGCAIVGGDLAQGRDVTVAVTVFGECPGRGAIYRSGAEARRRTPGHRCRSAARPPVCAAVATARSLSDELVVAHRRPWPRLAEGMAARGAGVHAMMDLSDGLGLDLHRFADASGVGFELTDVPVADGATIEEAISGGEDYELLIATDDAARLRLVFHDRGLARAAHHRRGRGGRGDEDVTG